MKKRLSVTFSGRVQGVGFRYTAEEIANDIGLTGWVKNIAGGKVEAEAEGEEKELKEFISRLKERFGTHISNIEEDRMPATGEFSGFEVRF